MLHRLVLNLFGGWFRLSRYFPASTLRKIHDAIAHGEQYHAGELRFAVEARYSPVALLSGLHSRQRAQEIFSQLRVWDTQDNSGVLIYLQLAERRVELVADRGIAARVDECEWQKICDQVSSDIRDGSADKAVLTCIEKVNALLSLHFPAESNNPQELSNEPVVL